MKSNRKANNGMVKNSLIIGAVCLVTLLLTIASIVFLKNRISDGVARDGERVGEVESDFNFESASTEIGKTVEETKNEINEDNSIQDDLINTAKKSEENDLNKEEKKSDKKENSSNNSTIEKEQEESNKKSEEDKQITFNIPVKGEIIREFASDSLVYSETLQEWITHKGVDIKADKTSIVCSAYDGTIEAIKTDPRYGLTIIINHENGFKTVYSNLLTAEFVEPGEKVTTGQTIATVGNTASFEIADEAHLHFELLKDDEYQDPTIYLDI